MDLQKQAPTISAVCLTALTMLATGAALFWLRPVLVPFVFALFLSICVTPLVHFLRDSLRLPQSLAVIVTVLLGLGIVVAVTAIAASAVAELRVDGDTYAAQLARLKSEWIDPTIDALHLPEAMKSSLNPLNYQDRLPALLAAAINELLSIASDGAIVLIFLFFLLASQSADAPSTDSTWFQIRTSIGSYMTLKIFISALTALLVWGTLEAFRVPLALVFGLLTFTLNFVPNIGSVIATALPVPVILMNAGLDGPSKFGAIAIPAVIQFTIGNVVEPKLMGRSLDLHPAVVMLSLIIWGWLWGIVGVLLAVPMTAALKIVLEKLGYTQPLAELLAGRGVSGPRGPDP